MKLICLVLWICLTVGLVGGEKSIIRSKQITYLGDWSEYESCEPGSFVIGFRQKVELNNKGDNTALNAIQLICSDKQNTRIQGNAGKLGKWSKDERCKDKQTVKGFQLKQQEPQGEEVDDTAANALRLICQDDSVIMADNDGKWGNWSKIKECPRNNSICGLSVQIDEVQGSGDDTSLNNVDFQCCSHTYSGKHIILLFY